MFVDSAIYKELPVPGVRRADVLDVEPDVRSAIARELVIPLRSLVELVGAFDIIEEKAHLHGARLNGGSGDCVILPCDMRRRIRVAWSHFLRGLRRGRFRPAKSWR